MAKLKVFRGKGHYARAKGAANAHQMVCGAYIEDGSPVAFLVESDASEQQISDLAFTVRHGRPPQVIERQLQGIAERLKARGL